MNAVSEPWRIPRQWSWGTFADAAVIAQDLVDPASVPNMPHIAPNNIGVANRQLLTYATVKEDGVRSPKQRFSPKQILFTKIRPYLLKSVMVDFEGVCSADMYPLWARQTIDPHYLLYWITSPDFRDVIAHSQGRSVLPKINQSELNATALPIPPKEEQRRIVAKIDSLLAKSKRARDHLDHLPKLVEKYKQAVLEDAFSAYQASDWRACTLEDVLTDALIGLVRSRSEQSAEGGTPYIRMNHYNLDGQWNFNDLTHVAASHDEKMRYSLREGDVLFNTRNSYELVGKVAIWKERTIAAVFNNNLLRLRFKSEIDPKFVFYQLMSPNFRSYLNSSKSATTSVCAIYQRSVMAAPFAYPYLGRQRDVVSRIETAFAWIDRLAAEATSARKLIDHLDQAVLAKALRGELVSQNPDDEPASALLERVSAARDGTAPMGRRRGRPRQAASL